MSRSLPHILILSLLCSAQVVWAQPQHSSQKSKSAVPATKNTKTATDTETDRKASKANRASTSGRSNATRLSAEQQEAALQFATEHHAELAKLLKQLHRKSPTAFARGIREVHVASQRIQRLQERAPNRVDAELRRWKMDSEIRLLTARWAMSKDPQLEQKIQKLLRQRQEARLDEMKSERDRLAERLRLLDKQIGMGTAELDEYLEREFQRLSRQALSAARQQRSKRGKANARPTDVKSTYTKNKPRD